MKQRPDKLGHWWCFHDGSWTIGKVKWHETELRKILVWWPDGSGMDVEKIGVTLAVGSVWLFQPEPENPK